MDNNLVKTGSCSIVLGHNHYMTYKPIKPFKLLKITKVDRNNDEFKTLSTIRTIENYSQYFSIPDEVTYLLQPSNQFYDYIKTLVPIEESAFMNGTLHCCYMDYAGNKELLETINDIEAKYDFTIWKSYKTILNFSKHILEGLGFLHEKKMCHLDIKPENIIVNTYKKTYKIIDFGFSSIEPFDDFVKHTRGTPGYFPKYFNTETPTPWLPKVAANDMIYDNNILFHIDRLLVYKIDSYCLGRVLYMLRYIYNDNRVYVCFNAEKKNKKKLTEIINSLVENNANKRMTINQCLKEFF